MDYEYGERVKLNWQEKAKVLAKEMCLTNVSYNQNHSRLFTKGAVHHTNVFCD
jgi:hypothetical protein